MPVNIKLDNIEYLWNDTNWIDLRNYMIPPDIIIQKLNRELAKIDIDYTNLSFDDLKRMASNFKDSNNFQKAQEVIDYALSKTPGDPAILSILCSLLRKKGKPGEALEKTTNSNYPNGSLLTSRAAAMCDLERWEDAKKEVGRALAITNANNQKQEAFNVVKRIKENAPHLYEN